MWEAWTKATKLFATMSIYKASILFFDGQGIHIITSSTREHFSFYIKENPGLPHHGKNISFHAKETQIKSFMNLRQFLTFKNNIISYKNFLRNL